MHATKKDSLRTFKVDARALLSLGRESIKDHTTALVELVKNAYDADAENVELEVISDSSGGGRIRIADDGEGMSSQDLNTKWLRIGFSDKRKRKISPKGRRETGEKGIGRLSADRLGALLELRTKTSDSKSVAVAVDWDSFDVDGAEIGSVPIYELVDSDPDLPVSRAEGVATGTEIRISKLRQAWSDSDIRNLEIELSTLVPPILESGEFRIWLRTNEDAELAQLSPPFQDDAELEMDGDFDADGRLSYVLTARPKPGSRKRHQIRTGKISWEQLRGGDCGEPFRIGRVRVRLSFFLRAGVQIEGFSLGQLRDYLDTFGGIRIYRDQVRVKPYGDPSHAEGDWLGLSERKARNPAGAARRDFRINANQLVGSVFIGRDSNPKLTDSAAREGLVRGDAYSQLASAVFSCVNLLEALYHERFVADKSKDLRHPELPTVVETIRSSLAQVKKELEGAGRAHTGGSSNRVLNDSVAKIEVIEQHFAEAERGIEELANQATVYRGLATVGISSAVFGHETESALAQAKISTGLAIKALDRDKPRLELCNSELAKANRAIDRVQVWGQFALSRVRKDKRRRTKLDIGRVVTSVVDEMRPLFLASSIELQASVDSGAELKAFAMDIEALTLNLLTNAYHAARQAKKDRVVRVHLRTVLIDSIGWFELSVDDSGPGITKEHASQIWVPLFSTRTDARGRSTGTGLGLTIVKSIVGDIGATIQASPKGILGGASFRVTIPKGGAR